MECVQQWVGKRERVQCSEECRLRCMLPVRDAQNRIEGGDHRFMDMQGIRRSDGSVLVLLGDSKGQLQFFWMESEEAVPVCVLIVEAHSTPILCVDLCQAEGQLFGFAGTAARDLLVFHVDSLRKNVKPSETIHMIKTVHSMGINDIAVSFRDSKVFCVSVGDDQSLRICTFSVNEEKIVLLNKISYMEVSGMSIRSYCWVDSGVYFVGEEQTVQKRVWINEGLVKSGWTEEQVTETSCLALWEGTRSGLGAICGIMGIEVFEYLI